MLHALFHTSLRSRLPTLQAQQKSGDDIRAGLQRACEQQIDAVRNRAAKQAEAHGRCTQSLPAAVTHAICEALFSGGPQNSAALPLNTKQHILAPPLEKLVQVVVDDVWRTGTGSATAAPHQQDSSAKSRKQLAIELAATFSTCEQQAIGQDRDTCEPRSERQEESQVGALTISTITL